MDYIVRRRRTPEQIERDDELEKEKHVSEQYDRDMMRALKASLRKKDRNAARKKANAKQKLEMSLNAIKSHTFTLPICKIELVRELCTRLREAHLKERATKKTNNIAPQVPQPGRFDEMIAESNAREVLAEEKYEGVAPVNTDHYTHVFPALGKTAQQMGISFEDAKLRESTHLKGMQAIEELESKQPGYIFPCLERTAEQMNMSWDNAVAQEDECIKGMREMGCWEGDK